MIYVIKVILVIHRYANRGHHLNHVNHNSDSRPGITLHPRRTGMSGLRWRVRKRALHFLAFPYPLALSPPDTPPTVSAMYH